MTYGRAVAALDRSASTTHADAAVALTSAGQRAEGVGNSGDEASTRGAMSAQDMEQLARDLASGAQVQVRMRRCHLAQLPGLKHSPHLRSGCGSSCKHPSRRYGSRRASSLSRGSSGSRGRDARCHGAHTCELEDRRTQDNC